MDWYWWLLIVAVVVIFVSLLLVWARPKQIIEFETDETDEATDVPVAPEPPPYPAEPSPAATAPEPPEPPGHPEADGEFRDVKAADAGEPPTLWEAGPSESAEQVTPPRTADVDDDSSLWEPTEKPADDSENSTNTS